MNFSKFAQNLSRVFRHLQIAKLGANPRAKLTEASVLLTDASEEIESAIEAQASPHFGGWKVCILVHNAQIALQQRRLCRAI